MDVNKVVKGYKIFVGCAAWYLTSRLIDKKTEDWFDGRKLNVVNATDAFLLGAGQGAVSMAVGITVAKTIGKIL